MKSNHIISITVLLLLLQAVGAQDQREAAMMEYQDAILQGSVDHQRPPVDPSISWEGMSTGAQPDDLTPGYVIIDGDIQVRAEELDAFLGGPARAVFGTVNYWDGNTVPYDFAGNVNATNQQNAINAMNAISALTGVIFRVRLGGDPDWVRFNASTFNNSPVGRQGGQQIINIVSWGTQIIIVHELYHSLGFWHEQSASDRDTYVTINFGNICGSSAVPGNQCNANVCQGCSDSMGNFISCAFNFNITAGAGLWGPYDFDSFMHYGRTAFSCNGGDTITVNPTWNAQWQSVIGQRTHFSLVDELSCRGIYPFAGDRWLRIGGSGFAGTFFAPYGAFQLATVFTPVNGTLLIDPGTYSGVGTYSQAVTIRGTYGVATIGN
ncbi:MAG: M12 family metallopeptidase [Planctomycetota bacterium]